MAKIQMYSKVPCPYCVNAKRFFIEKEIEFEEIDMTDNLGGLDEIKKQYGWKTVPLILIDGKLIGGYTDLKDLNESGELDKLLAK